MLLSRIFLCLYNIICLCIHWCGFQFFNITNNTNGTNPAIVRLYWAAQHAIIKCHRLDGINNAQLFSHSSGGWKDKIRVPAWFLSGETSLPGLQAAAIPLCTHTTSSLSGCVGKSPASVVILLIRTPNFW